MKVKEYIAQFEKLKRETPNEETEYYISYMAILFVEETEQMIKTRNCQSNEAFDSVYKEVQAKWYAFVRAVELLGYGNAYSMAVRQCRPKLHELCVKRGVLQKLWD